MDGAEGAQEMLRSGDPSPNPSPQGGGKPDAEASIDWTEVRRALLPVEKRVPIETNELRLNALVSVGIAILERRLAEEGLTIVNARTLTELCRAEELRMRTTRQKTAKSRETKNNDAAHDFRDDPAWLDAEFKRRLDRLFDEGRVGDGVEANDAARAAGTSGAMAGKIRGAA